jgi:hypothetical protein
MRWRAWKITRNWIQSDMSEKWVVEGKIIGTDKTAQSAAEESEGE